MKKELKQAIKIAVLGVLTLTLLILTVLELLPGKTTALEISETVTVSSALTDTASGKYETAFAGRLFNDSSSTVTVDAINVTVENGTGERTARIPLAVQLAPRTEYVLAYSEADTAAYHTVTKVTAEVSGEVYSLANVQASAIGAAALILIACLLICGFFLYRAILVRYYMYQEAKLLEKR
ncbi:MAG: hypothetical protein IJW16_01065 [Clostridia bacterium]|nr:hypothetical protein [Clostridia bacterium]